MFKFLKNLFVIKTEQQKIEEYLADSISLEDLERRQTLIARNEAAFQLRSLQNYVRSIY